MYNRMKRWLVLLLACASASAGVGQIAELTVEAGGFDRFETPVSICLDELTFLPDTGLVLYEWNGGDKTPVAFQVEESPQGRILSWILSGNTLAGTMRKYTIEQGRKPDFQIAIDCAKGEEALLLSSGEDKIVSYRYAAKQPPAGTDPKYCRSGFIHPLWSPSGVALTDIQPADHPHHYGMMNPWTKTTFEGKTVDFWNLQKGEGTVRFKAISSMEKGPVCGGFRVVQEHVVFESGCEKVALNEQLQVKAWNVKDPSNRKAWLWDYITTENCASDSALLLNEYRYGGLLFRGTPEWTDSTSEILTSEGKTRADADGSLARWMLCSGKTPSGECTLLMMSYPANYNHPEPVRVWPKESTYIFMNFSPTKNKDWLMLPGKDYTRRYRMVVCDGKMTARQAEQYWRDYAYPPRIQIKK